MPSKSLFRTHTERMLALLALLLLASLSLVRLHHDYRHFLQSRYIEALVLNQYPKGHRLVFKLKSRDGVTFYTSTYQDLKDLRDRWVLFRKFDKKLGFWEYLRGFYAPGYILKLLPKERRYLLREAIAKQHNSKMLQEMFGALFVASAMSKESRDEIARFGIAHLFAISGFHLGLLAMVVFGLLGVVVRPLWQRFVPYWQMHTLLMAIITLLAGWYMGFLGYTPSIVRSFVMLLFGYYMLHRGLRLLSFETLFWAVLIILALFPTLLFSLGFWLSVAGVFYIYLFLHHFAHLHKVALLLLLNCYLFAAMLPVTLALFGKWSATMLLSPLLTLLFSLLYPFALLVHLGGHGDLADFVVMLFAIKSEVVAVQLPWWQLALYLALSGLAILHRFLFFGALLFGLVVVVEHVA